MANTTTATQRRDRRRELEEKYGLRSTTNNSMPSTLRDEKLNDIKSGLIGDFSKKTIFLKYNSYRKSSIKIIIKFRWTIDNC